ncbi:hypothetical protein PO124_06860 [Bacillus licheniformis]|nr:hypothetical protein [Bacillus licheniformis]
MKTAPVLNTFTFQKGEGNGHLHSDPIMYRYRAVFKAAMKPLKENTKSNHSVPLTISSFQRIDGEMKDSLP